AGRCRVGAWGRWSRGAPSERRCSCVVGGGGLGRVDSGGLGRVGAGGLEPGVPQDRGVDDPAVVLEHPGVVPFGGLQHVAGPGGLGGAGRIGGADGGGLGGMDAGGGSESARGGVLGLGAPGVLVGEVGVDRVDRAAAVGAGGQQHAGTGVADHVAVAAVGAAGGGARGGGGGA